jgi:hypothetical protein
MSGKSVFCISDSEAQASELINQLKLAGFANDDISALLPDKTGSRDFAHERHTKAPEGAVAGFVIGVACAAVGWLAGIGVVPLGGLGQLVAAGPVIAALSGAAAGAAFGGAVGALVGLGMPEYEARRYEGKIHEGNILISVHCATAPAARVAKNLFDRAGARHIAASAEAPVKVPSPEQIQPVHQAA